MKVGLFMGQSNAVGAGYGGSWDIDARVTAWNCESNREDTTVLGSAWVAPQRDANPFKQNDTMVLNNQGAHVAHYLARALNEPQRLVIVARNGKSIAWWHDGTAVGVLYDRMMAVRAACGVTKFDWFGWNQGSADNGSAGAYTTKWNALIARMMSDGVIDATTPIFVSETAWGTTPLINPVLEAIAESSPRIGLARIGNYETQDGVHFTGASLAMAGYEAVRAMAETNTIFENIVNPLAVNFTPGTGYSSTAG